MMRLTFDQQNILPQWTPDGAHIVYGNGSGEGTLMKRADGVGDPIRILPAGEDLYVPGSWSPDGRLLMLMAAIGSARGSQPRDVNIALLRRDPAAPAAAAPAGAPEPLMAGPFAETWPELSPDGRWLAYASNESGDFQIYVRPAPPSGRPAGGAARQAGPGDAGGRWQVSLETGVFPRWSRAGRELFYIERDRMMVVPYEVRGDSFEAARPRMLFQGGFVIGEASAYDVAPDGLRFAMLLPQQSADAIPDVPATFVFNWFEELKRLAPAGP
jgi:serine/threonine-protein kinase